MIEPLTFTGAAAHARIITAALALGRNLDLWSLALVSLALVSLLWLSLPLAATICVLISLLAGGTQKIVALRVAFDAALFRHWAKTWSSVTTEGRDPETLVTDLATLDQALASCGLRAPPTTPVRDLDSRLRGALRLLRQQVLCCAIQFAAMLGAAVAMRVLPPT